MFLFRGTADALAVLLGELGRLIRPAEDVVQAWPLPPGADPGRFAVGAVRPVDAVGVVVAGSTRFVARPVRHSTDQPPS